jgi:site-specific DNA-methyltransferase (adenine-specific)
MEQKHNSITTVEDNNVKPHLHKTQCCVQPFSVHNEPLSELYNMDCIQGMKHYPDGYFDLAIVDPPYGIGEDGGNFRARKGQNKGVYEKGNWDKVRPNYEYFIELFRVSKNQIIWGANYYAEHLPPSMGWIYWDKKMGGDFSDGELAYTSFNKALKSYSYCNKIGTVGFDRIHPTQKPIKLYDFCLQYAKVEKGMKILDTHLGSGSSRISCYINGFDFVGFEINKKYCEASEKRFVNAISQQRLSF